MNKEKFMFITDNPVPINIIGCMIFGRNNNEIHNTTRLIIMQKLAMDCLLLRSETVKRQKSILCVNKIENKEETVIKYKIFAINSSPILLIRSVRTIKYTI